MNYIKYILILITGITIYSCDTEEFLNPDPASAIGETGFFSNDAEIYQGLIGVYDSIQGISEENEGNWANENRGIQYEFLLSEHRSDNTRSLSQNERAEYHTYLVQVGDIYSEDYYASMYELIFRANNILKFVDVADAGNVAAYTAEAKFLRAFGYFNLVRMYGAVPLVTEVITKDDERAYVRVDVSTVYAQIVEDLLEGVTNLPDGSKGRASKAAAEALLAKVYLSQPNPNYLGAQELLESVMNPARGFMLQSNFSDIYYNELNDEVIFAIEYLNDNEDQSQIFSAEFSPRPAGREDGLNIPEDNLIAAFDMNGGNRTEASFYYDNGVPYCAKFLPNSSDLRNAGNDWIVLRLADVLLLHAEAILAGAQSTSSGNAIESVNKVRRRAGLTDLSGSLSVDELLLERRVELAFENQRFHDLQRFGITNTVLSAYSAELGYSYNINQLLMPIPPREINQSNGAMAQNPGY